MSFVGLVVGNMCLVESIFLAICAVLGFCLQESDAFPFLYSTLIMAAVGGIIVGSSKRGNSAMRQATGRREGMLAVTLTWLTLSVIGMLPFIFGGYTESWVDAFFETASGFTTTGATIFTSVEHLPHGILLWRSFTQWQGGIGIVVFTLALLPMLNAGGSILYNAEATGITHERFMPRIAEVARRLSILYVGLTVVLMLLLMAGPVGCFDAICHAFTCVSTGGYSTHDKGILKYNSAYVEYVMIIFMFLGSLNMPLLIFALSGKPKRLFGDEEFRWFLGSVVGFTVITLIWLMTQKIETVAEPAFRHAAFQVVSLASSTGYVTADMNSWQPFFFCLALMMMTVCGCAGSTAGGLKMSRLMVLLKNLNNEFKKRMHPSVVTNVRINGVSLDTDRVIQVLAFIVLYLLLILAATLVLTCTGNDFITSLSSAFTCISNVGPAFGEHSSHFATALPVEKLILSFIMIAGRLEVFTVACLFYPSFWRNN